MQKRMFLCRGAIVLIALCLPICLFSEEPEAISLSGKPLYRSALQGNLEKLKADLRKAQADYEQDPNDPERIIWLGRRTAYLWRYRDAINIYSKGIKKYPDNPKLYRHRGHRYISVRELDKAIADLETAAKLTENTPDEIEPDGAPNKYNIPRSTLKFNIWYHLGLARYLKGDFENALDAYLECMKYSKNDDVLCATSDWLYMTYRRLGRDKEAQKVLATIHKEMEILENISYHNRLLMYKGLKSPEDLLALEHADELTVATQGYGVGSWYLYIGETEKASKIFKKVVSGNYWPAFGYIAAEADLRRLEDSSFHWKIEPTIYLVRHAEKLPGWPENSIGDFWPLSREGVARAEKLANHFKDVQIAAVYSSPTTRTLHTAFAISQKKQIPITVADACKDTSAIDAFYKELNEKFRPNESVLLVTHSNLIPYLLIKAGLPKWCEEKMGLTRPAYTSWILIEGYDNLWKIVRPPDNSDKCSGFSKTKF